MPRLSGRAALLACLAMGLATPLLAQDAPAPSPEPAEADEAQSSTLGLKDEEERLSVPVRIDDRGPYHFIVDTGAERTVISKQLATRLALQPGGSVTLHSMNGSGVVETAVIPSLNVSKNPVSGIRAPKLEEAHLGASGILGTDMLRGQKVLFNFVDKKMTVTRSRRARLGPDEIVVNGKSRYGRLVIADARAEGEKILVVIDTGSEITIGNEALRRKLTGRQKMPAAIPVTMYSVLGEQAIVDYTQLKKITIGGVVLSNMPIAFADVHLFKQLDLLDRPALLLGMDTLQMFDKVAIDFATRKVQFLTPGLSMGRSPVRLAAR